MVVGSGLSSCSKEYENQDELVVEGWICQDAHPIVLIHKSYAIFNPQHQDDDLEKQSIEEIMQGQLIPWGRVTISDGDREVVLTGRLDTLYTPPFVYTTTKLIGQVGKQYRVTVDYKNYHATATSAIPEPVAIDSLCIRVDSNKQTTNVLAYLSHLPHPSYYLVEYKTVDAEQFNICPLGTASSDQAIDGVLSINILSKDADVRTSTSALHHFVTDTNEYVLRLNRIDCQQYDYFTDLASQLASQGMFFVSAYKNLPSNIDGGIGYWVGKGSSDYHFFINKDTTYYY